MMAQHRTVLIVDSCSDDRATYRRYLIEDPDFAYTVLEEDSAAAGLTLCQGQIIDGILLEFRLPDIDGLQFLVELKQQIGVRCPPVVMVTGHGNEAVAVKAIKSGADDYLVKKEITALDLRSSLGSAIENRFRKQLQTSVARLSSEYPPVPKTFEFFGLLRCDGTLLEANQSALDYVEITALDVLGRPFWEARWWTSQETQVQLQQAIASSAAGEFVRYEVDVLGAENTISTIDFSLKPVTNEVGDVVLLIFEGRDITQKQKVEKQLQESQRLIEQIANTTPGIFYLYDLIADRNIYTNRQIAELLGYTTEEIQAMGSELLPTLIHPEDFANVPAEIERFYFAQEGDVFEKEYRMQHRNGEWRWFFGREVVFSRTPNGLPHQILGICQDITERKLTEIKLSRVNELFELAALAVNCLIYDWDIESGTVDRTHGLTRLLGYTLEESQPTLEWWRDRIHPEDLSRSRLRMPDMSTVDRYCLEYRVLHKNGDYLWVQDMGIVAHSKEGRAVRVVGSTRDITKGKQAEEKLRRNEERLQSMVETSQIGIAFANSKGEIIETNKAFLVMLGYTRWQFCESGINWRAITPTEYPQMDGQEMAQLQAIGKTEPTEKELIRQDKTRIPILVSFARVQGEEDEYVAFVVDITERKRTEAALQEQEVILRSLGDNLPNGVLYQVVRELDGRPHLSYISAGIEDMTGLKPDALMEDMNLLEEQFLPADRERFNQAIAQSIENFSIIDLQVQRRTTQGEIRWTQLRSAPRLLEDGRTVWDGVEIDITERKHTEEALRESEERHRYLTEAIPHIVWTASSLGKIDYVNQRGLEYTGLTVEEVMGLGWLKATHPEDSQEAQQRWFQAWQKGQDFEIEYRLRRGSDGMYRWHLVRVLPIKDNLGQIVKWFGTCTDIHEQKQLEAERAQLLEREQTARQQAELANHSKDEFLAIVSHELRSPLNSILGWAKLLRTRKFDEANTNRALETIERNAKAQSQLIEDLLDVSRMIRGNLRLNLTPVNLKGIIETTINVISPTALAKQIQIESKLDINPCQVSGDFNRLQQIIGNLLSNAIKFTPPGGSVEVSLSSSSFPTQQYPPHHIESSAVIKITDTGKGISPDFLPYVFDRFRQADNTTTRGKDGLGLGLAIVSHLVELHGGTVCADSPGVGQGATFTVTLPLIKSPDPKLPSADSSPENIQNSVLSNLRILVVDDEADTREFMNFALSEYGAVVTTVSSAADAFAVLNDFQPDILISDISMPDMDGYNFLRQLRSQQAQVGGKQIPAIALTANARQQDSDKAIDAGFQRHMTKPVEPADLVTAIEDVIAKT
jgi:PAS domain S-box-containing protein